MVDVKQAKRMIPLMTCETSFGQNVSELVFGVDVFDLDFGIEISSIKQPIKCHSVGSGNMSHLMIILITASLSSISSCEAS